MRFFDIVILKMTVAEVTDKGFFSIGSTNRRVSPASSFEAVWAMKQKCFALKGEREKVTAFDRRPGGYGSRISSRVI